MRSLLLSHKLSALLQQLKEYEGLILKLKEMIKVFEKVEEVGKSSLSPEALAIYLAIMEHMMQSKMIIERFQRKKCLPKKAKPSLPS